MTIKTDQITCDWCFTETKLYIPAKYVVCTGRIDTMKVREFFICGSHADKLCAQFRNGRGIIAGTTFDVWELHWITEKAREFYIKRAERQFINAAKRTMRARNLPYTFPQLDHWSVRREGGFHWNPREIRKSLPVHGVRVGDRAALWNRSHSRS